MSDAHRIAVAAARGAAAAVEASRGRLNDLNVYPVPDGDTGSNLADTARELVTGLEAATAGGPAAVAAAAKRAVLMGASGNSGAILSQIVGGFADVAGGAEEIDSHVLARALRSATEAAYRPVQQPIEGTMLTVIREMAETAEGLAGGELGDVLDAVLEAGAESLARTQGMLAVLRDAGVVDAGAAGLVEFCRGAVAGARGEHIQAPLEAIDRPLSFEAVHQEESLFRYCTSFLLEGDDIDRDRLEAELLAMGDCLLVVGEAPMCRVHLHTDDPGAALSRAVAMGSLDRVAIANMHEQTRRREERLSAAPTLVALPGGRADTGGLTAENTAVVLDSTADLAHPEREHANWRMVPLTVRFGDEQFEDYREIAPAEFYRRLRNGGPHPQTAAPSPGAYLRAYEALSGYAHIIVLPVSSKVSGSVQAARIAAEDPAAGGRVTVLDGLAVGGERCASSTASCATTRPPTARCGSRSPTAPTQTGPRGWRRPCAGCGRRPGSSGCPSSVRSWGRTAAPAHSACWCWRSVERPVRGWAGAGRRLPGPALGAGRLAPGRSGHRPAGARSGARGAAAAAGGD